MPDYIHFTSIGNQEDLNKALTESSSKLYDLLKANQIISYGNHIFYDKDNLT